MKSTPKKKGKPKMLDYPRGISRGYRLLTRLQAQLSDWKPEAETLFAKYNSTGDPQDFEAFAVHVTGAVARVREAIKEVGL